MKTIYLSGGDRYRTLISGWVVFLTGKFLLMVSFIMNAVRKTTPTKSLFYG